MFRAHDIIYHNFLFVSLGLVGCFVVGGLFCFGFCFVVGFCWWWWWLAVLVFVYFVGFFQYKQKDDWSTKSKKPDSRQNLAGKRMILLKNFPVSYGVLMNQWPCNKGSQKTDNFKFIKDTDPLDLEKTYRNKLPFCSLKILSLQSKSGFL